MHYHMSACAACKRHSTYSRSGRMETKAWDCYLLHWRLQRRCQTDCGCAPVHQHHGKFVVGRLELLHATLGGANTMRDKSCS